MEEIFVINQLMIQLNNKYDEVRNLLTGQGDDWLFIRFCLF